MSSYPSSRPRTSSATAPTSTRRHGRARSRARGAFPGGCLARPRRRTGATRLTRSRGSLQAKVGYADAILGCDVKVPTVDGDVTLNIPAGTQPETVPRARAADPPASWRRRCHSRARGRPVRRLEILRVLRPPPRSGGWARRLRVPCRARSALGCDIACGGGADADVGVCGDVLVMMVALLLLHARKPRHRRQRWRQRQRGSSPLPHPAIISEREITHWNIPPPPTLLALPRRAPHRGHCRRC